jgi:hypothetical protein
MFDPSLMVQQGPNPGERFAQAFQQGQATRQQNIAKAAQSALARDPTNAKALEAWSQVDPQGAMQFQQQQRQNHLKDLDAHRDSIKIGAQIIRSFNVKDEPSYQAAKQFAAQNGVDISQLPATYDQNYIANVIHLADALDPEKTQQDRIITPQPGGGAWALGPDGALHQLIAPNDGSQPPGAPVAGPAPGTVVADPRLQGGATGAAPSSMFP